MMVATSVDRIKIECKEDGVYVIIDNSNPEALVTRKELLEKIEEYKISMVDFEAVNEIFKEQEEEDAPESIEKRISSQKNVATKDETIAIEVSKDKMMAAIKLTRPEFGGKFLEAQTIKDQIKQFGITFGVNEEAIDKIVAAKDKKDYTVAYPVANGKQPEHGVNGKIVYTFDVTGMGNQPKILDDGTVDYKEIDYFTPVTAGTVLAYRTQETPGQAGMDIFSRPVQQKPGKPAQKLSKGKNVYITDDEMELKAQTSGQLVVSGKIINVSPVLEIKGDVGYETGNINFEGSVAIGGAVISGFLVAAQGNIEVKGVVEAASLKADGSINLYGGIQGRFKGRIEAGGNVFTKFAQNARIICDGNLVTNALHHCNITSKSSVILEGNNCFIAGGTVQAAEEVRAKTIGSYMGVRTEIKVVGNVEISTRYDEVKKQYEDLKRLYKKLNDDFAKISGAQDVTKLDAKYKNMLLQLVSHRNMAKERALKMEAELSEIVGMMRRTKGRIVAEKVIHHGVSVFISNAALHLHDDITATVLTNVNGAIKAEPNTGIY